MSLSESFIEIAQFTKTLLSRCAEKHDLTHQQIILLNNIPALDGISISDLSKRIGIDISTLSRNLNKMEGKNLTKRQKCGSDSRSYKIYITNDGERIVVNAINDFDMLMSNTLNSMNLSSSSSFVQNIDRISWELYKSINCEK